MQNVPYRILLLQETTFDVRRHHFMSRDFTNLIENHIMGHNFWTVLTYDVRFLRHVTSNKMKQIEKNVFLQIVKVKGQTQG